LAQSIQPDLAKPDRLKLGPPVICTEEFSTYRVATKASSIVQ